MCSFHQYRRLSGAPNGSFQRISVRFREYLFGRPKSPGVFGFDFFGENNYTYEFLLFSKGQICRLECKVRLTSIFGEQSAARMFSGEDHVSLNFLRPKFSARTLNRSTCISLRKYPIKKLCNNLRKQKTIFQVFWKLIKFSRWVPLVYFEKSPEFRKTARWSDMEMTTQKPNVNLINH